MRSHLKLADAALRLVPRPGGAAHCARRGAQESGTEERSIRCSCGITGTSRRYDHEIGAQAVPPRHHGRADRVLSPGGRHAGRARGSLRAPSPAALDGQARRATCCNAIITGCAYDRTGTCVRVPGQDTIPRDGAGEDLSGGRALSLGLDLDGRSRRSPIPRRSPITIGSTIRTGARRAATCTSRRTGSSSSTTCSTSPISPSCMRPRSATPALVEHAEVKVQRTPDNVAGHALDHRPAGAADLRQGRQLHRQRRSLADHRFRAAGVPAARCRRDADRHRRAGGPARRRHQHAQPQCDHAGDRDHHAIISGAQAHDFDVDNAETDRHDLRADQDRLPRRRRVFEAQQRIIDLDSQSRRRSTSMPMPASSRRAASSTGCIATRRQPRPGWWRRSSCFTHL